ncbi:MAG: hypothetical protein ABWY12_18575 [Burkholderiales bacterium]
MNYPDWAPPNLVQWLKRDIETEKRFKVFDETLAAPYRGRIALLQRLITDLRMKDVWRALGKRIKDEREYLSFYMACSGGVSGWRRSQKLTVSEHKAFYQEIFDVATRLQTLIDQANMFDLYSIHNLIEDEAVEQLLEGLNAAAPSDENDPSGIRHTRNRLSNVVPSISAILA